MHQPDKHARKHRDARERQRLAKQRRRLRGCDRNEQAILDEYTAPEMKEFLAKYGPGVLRDALLLFRKLSETGSGRHCTCGYSIPVMMAGVLLGRGLGVSLVCPDCDESIFLINPSVPHE